MGFDKGSAGGIYQAIYCGGLGFRGCPIHPKVPK